MPMLSSLRRLADREIQLMSLGAGDSAQLLHLLSDGGELEQRLADRLTKRGQGNPLFLEELASAAGSDPGSALPATVRELVLRRFDALDAVTRAALRSAAVIGPSFGADLLEAVAGAAAGSAIESGLDHQLIEPSAAGGYAFRHALIWEAIYLDIVELERRRLHDSIATVLLASLEAAPETLCQHLFAAGRAGEALPLSLAAARHAETVGDYGSAAELHLRALAHTTGEVDRAVRMLAAGGALVSAGRIREGRAHLEAAADIFDRCDHSAGLLDACRQVSDLGDDADQGRLEQAIAKYAEAGPSRELGLAIEGRAMGLMLRNRLDEAEVTIRRGAEIGVKLKAQGIPMPPDVAKTMLSAMRGGFDPGQFLRLHEIFIELDLPFGAVAALNNGIFIALADLLPNTAELFCARLGDARLGGRAMLSLRTHQVVIALYLGHTRKHVRLAEEVRRLTPPSEGIRIELLETLLGCGLAASDRLGEAESVIRKVQSPPNANKAEIRQHLLRAALDCQLNEVIARELSVLQPQPYPSVRWRLLIGTYVEAMIGMGELEEARRAVDNPPAGLQPSDPFHQHGLGLVALADSRSDLAETHLRRRPRSLGKSVTPNLKPDRSSLSPRLWTASTGWRRA